MRIRIMDKIAQFLSDGLPKSREEIWLNCMDDVLPTLNKDIPNPWHPLQLHISALRKRLEKRGELIVCELRGYKISYRRVRMLKNK